MKPDIRDFVLFAAGLIAFGWLIAKLWAAL